MYALSLVIAGPVVRRVEPTRVSIWIALRSAATVVLRVQNEAGILQMKGRAQTVAIGQNLNIVVVSAGGGEELAWGQSYLFELEIDGEPLDVRELLYPNGPAKLSFVTPGNTLEDTHLVHGSCRHPEKPGGDALSILDDLLCQSFTGRRKRPQLFVCSGDFIYADSPSSSMLALVGNVGDELLGYREELPGCKFSASEIPEKQRREISRSAAGIIDPPARQLFGFGEYVAMHLLVLSPVLWPKEVPGDLRCFHRTLSKVRRALANTAFYAIFDDHEITDDWNLTQAWSQQVLEKPLGRQMVCNGLAAFAVVHAWGNQPTEFEQGTAGERVVSLLIGQRLADEEIFRALGVPAVAGATQQSAPDALPWHFRLLTPVLDVRALDTRTMRRFPANDPHGVPELLNSEALQTQLSDWEGMPCLIVSAPMAPPPQTAAARWIRRLGFRWQNSNPEYVNVYGPDRGDEWMPTSDFFRKMLDCLPATWVCLGGDTHISYAASIEQTAGISAIFVSSGMQRESRERRWRQRLGYGYPWPFRFSAPVSKGTSFVMRYLHSNRSASGKRYEYFAKNNIGCISFEDKNGQRSATQTLCWRDAHDEINSVVYRSILR